MQTTTHDGEKWGYINGQQEKMIEQIASNNNGWQTGNLLVAGDRTVDGSGRRRSLGQRRRVPVSNSLNGKFCNEHYNITCNVIKRSTLLFSELPASLARYQR